MEPNDLHDYARALVLDDACGEFEEFKRSLDAVNDPYVIPAVLTKFSEPDQLGDVIRGLDSLADKPAELPVYIEHDTSKTPIGLWKVAYKKDGVYGVAYLTRGIRAADEMALAIAAKTVKGVSIGGRTAYEKTESGAPKYTPKGGLYVAGLRLREASFTTNPAHLGAQVTKNMRAYAANSVPNLLAAIASKLT